MVCKLLLPHRKKCWYFDITKRLSLTLARADVDSALSRERDEPASGTLPRPMNKVLMLAYRFPPQGGGGVQRTLKFVKYLPQWGWLPVVHTVSNAYWPLQDVTLLAEIPQAVTVHRTRTFEFEKLGHSTDALLSGRANQRGGADDDRPARTARRASLRRLLSGAAGVVNRHVLVPDPQIAWIPAALVKSLYLARKEGVALIYSS